VALHVAILGGGNISGTHARAAAAAGLVVAAVHGRHPDKVRAMADAYGATPYADLDACLAHPSLDAVLIGSPSGVHADQGIAAATRGLHVLVEKPIDVTVERADALIEAATHNDVRLGVMFQDRTQPPFVALQRTLASGRLGRPLVTAATVRWYRPPDYYAKSGWRGTWALDGGGALMNQGIHTLDLLLWLFGRLARVSARVGTLLHPIEVEDTAVAVLEFASGALATYEATTAAYPGYPRRLEITTSEGTIAIEHSQVIRADVKSGAEDLIVVDTSRPSQGPSSPVVSDISGHQRLVEDFAEAIRDRRDPLCSGAEGRRSLVAARAIYESARTGRVVDVMP
jgi:predicted dehydrogenase